MSTCPGNRHKHLLRKRNAIMRANSCYSVVIVFRCCSCIKPRREVFRASSTSRRTISLARIPILALGESSLQLHPTICFASLSSKSNNLFFFLPSPFESRFPINVGITGYVATTGEVSIARFYTFLRRHNRENISSK